MSATTQITNDIALIRMDDGKANAINFEMIAALNAALDTAEAGAKAIVLAGRDGRFSGGFDLNAFASLGADGVYKLLDAGAELLLRLYGGPLPVVAACTGHAIAMGVFILNACDTRVGASGEYKIGANEAITGMNLPIFAMELARDRLSPQHLTRAMVQGFIYNPQGAVEAVAGQLAQLPGKAYAWNKKSIRKGTLDRIRASLGAHHKL
jgi:enoyl-CoA hydratase